MRNRLTPWVFGAALAAIPVLGYVQYRWIERVTAAELQRESGRLRRGLEQVAAGLDAEIARAHLWFALRPDEVRVGGPPTPDSVATAYSRKLDEWRSSVEFPAMVREIRFEFGGEARRVTAAGKTESAPPLPDFRRDAGPGRRTGPLLEIDGLPALVMPVLRGGRPPEGPGPPGFGQGRRRGPRGGGPPHFGDRPPHEDDGPPPARPREETGPGAPGGERRGERALVLDTGFISAKVVPALADRYLGRGSYELKVSAAGARLAGPEPEVQVRAFAMRPDCLLPMDDPDPRAGQRADLLRLPPRDCVAREGTSGAGLWNLAVVSALDASVGTFRTRNLILSFGVLLCLTGAIVALWVSTRRAAELAVRQMEFAMSVSHELRTPLTVMRLAGDNLAQGIATSPEQVRRYGETIRRESERLAGMVEQVLTFARAQRPDFVVRAQPVQAAQIVDGALLAADALLREAGFTVVREVESELPEVSADLNLTIAAVTNLLVNAVRHGGSGKWVRVRATATGHRVELEVADRGPGIAKRELRRIFRPFYRGAQSGSTQGTGLGLHLVRRIAEAHGGGVTVESSPGAGTVVTMALPIALRAAEEANT